VNIMIEVAAAIIENEQGHILIARRKQGKSQAGMWEFPGGKVELDETVEACLQRELLEEMNIAIDPYEFFAVNEHNYGIIQIRLIAYKAKYRSGEIQLIDHDQYRWVSKEELNDYQWSPADIPFVERLLVQQ